jgi:predicted acyltransferase
LRKFDGEWDPEGILSTFPAIATCLLGSFAGLFMMNKEFPAAKKGLYFIGAGVVLLASGYLWGLQFPVIKKIWTSSYVLVAGGYSCILLGVFYQIIDVWKWRAWTTPFVWIGSNALAVYMVRNMVDFRKIAERLVGSVDYCDNAITNFSVTCVSLGLIVLLAGYLYRKKVFIRI